MKKNFVLFISILLCGFIYFNTPVINSSSVYVVAAEITAIERQFWNMWQIADKYKNQNDKKNAILYYKKAENLIPAIRNKLTKSTLNALYHNIALCYYPDDFINAKNYALKAYNNGYSTIMTLIMIGDGYYANQQYKESQKYYQMALEELINEKVQTTSYTVIQRLIILENLVRERLELVHDLF